MISETRQFDRPQGLVTFAEREASLLAPYAMHSTDTAGRRHAEPPHPYRGPYQRDRDRVLHSSAYRRLSGKMQVFTGDMGDYHRTRLTHTQEVASIARTLGRALRLNEDLIEALALFHDIGHPPFGHAGEDALDECLRGEGGFSHNRHALTIAEELEIRYPNFRGLNLSREVLDGQATRTASAEDRRNPLLEVQVVDAADSVTYDAHDADDAVKLGIVTLDELAQIPLIRRMLDRVLGRFPDLPGDMVRITVIHELIDFQVSDVLQVAGEFLAETRPRSAAEARQLEFVIGPSPQLTKQKKELESFLQQRVYRHPRLLEVRQRGQQRLKRMFEGYLRRTDLLPAWFQLRAEQDGLRVAVGDYLAGMTDRFCEQQYHRYFSAEIGG